MNISRLTYPSLQFWNALLSSSKRLTSEALLFHLSSAQLILFRRMQPAEQVHSYQMCKHLGDGGKTNPDLLTAALLHHVGKIQNPKRNICWRPRKRQMMKVKILAVKLL